MARKAAPVKVKLICRRGMYYMSFSGIYGRKGGAYEYEITKTQEDLCDLVRHVAHKTWMTDDLMLKVHRIADDLSPCGIDVVKHWRILSKRKVAHNALPPPTEGAFRVMTLLEAALADVLKNGETRWQIYSSNEEVADGGKAQS